MILSSIFILLFPSLPRLFSSFSSFFLFRFYIYAFCYLFCVSGYCLSPSVVAPYLYFFITIFCLYSLIYVSIFIHSPYLQLILPVFYLFITHLLIIPLNFFIYLLFSFIYLCCHLHSFTLFFTSFFPLLCSIFS